MVGESKAIFLERCLKKSGGSFYLAGNTGDDCICQLSMLSPRICRVNFNAPFADQAHKYSNSRGART